MKNMTWRPGAETDYAFLLTEPEARSVIRRLVHWSPPPGAPMRWDDCFMLGLWARLEGGERLVSRAARTKYLALSRIGFSPRTSEADEPDHWLEEEQIDELPSSVMAMHLELSLGVQPMPSEREEVLLVLEGALLALFVPRVYYAGAALLRLLGLRSS